MSRKNRQKERKNMRKIKQETDEKATGINKSITSVNNKDTEQTISM